MAKSNRVVFNSGDAPKPKYQPQDGLVHIGAGINYVFKGDSTTTVKTGVKADRAVIVVGTGYLKVDKFTLIPPGEEIVFEAKNLSNTVLPVGRGETLARCYVLDSGDVEIA
jgi:hypothetical protein